jgi:surface protein
MVNGYYPLWGKIIILLGFISFFVACTPKKQKGPATITIQSKSLLQASSFPNAGLICFGVNISADDIPVEVNNSCNPKLSTYTGFVSLDNDLVLEVERGENRKIELFAFVSGPANATTSCPTWDGSIDYRRVFSVGETTIDLLEKENVVEIVTNFPGASNNLYDQLSLTACDSPDGTIPEDSPVRNVSIRSDNPYSDEFAIAGDAITLQFESDLPVAELSARVLGASLPLTLASNNLYTATYTIIGSNPEGVIPFLITTNGATYSTTNDGSSVVVDFTAPMPPAVSLQSPSFSISSNTTPVLSITGAEPNALIELHVDPTCSSLIGSQVANAASLSMTTSPVSPDVLQSFYVRQIDQAGNLSTCSSAALYYRAYSAQAPFVSTWETISDSETITLPLRASHTYDFLVDWGDGTQAIVTAHNAAEASHTYSTPGVYTIRMAGLAEAFYINNLDPVRSQIRTVVDLGDMGWINLENAFYGSVNLTTFAGGDTSLVTNMSGVFRDATNVVPDLSTWDVSSVTDMSLMFHNNTFSNPDVSAWDVSNVTSFSHMFAGCNSANPDVSAWDTGSATTMQAMFLATQVADPDVSAWDVTNVTTVASMFRGSTGVTSPNLNSWVTTSLTDTSGMFWSSTANPTMTGFDTSSVTNMSNMFYGAINFNSNISGWDTSSVTNMQQMFRGAMSFNQDLSAWDVSAVYDFSGMFRGASSFNQDLSIWDTSVATTLADMFRDATSADVDIASWVLPADMGNIFDGSSFSTANYESLLAAITALPGSYPDNADFHAGGAQYSSTTHGSFMTGVLLNGGGKNWTVTDGGSY